MNKLEKFSGLPFLDPASLEIFFTSATEYSRAENHFHGVLLMMLSSALNDFPYWLPANSICLFHQGQEFYVQDIQQWKVYEQKKGDGLTPLLCMEAYHFCKDVYAHRQAIYDCIRNSMCLMRQQLKKGKQSDDWFIIERVINALNKAQTTLLNANVPALGWQRDYQMAHQDIDSNWRIFSKQIMTTKQKTQGVYNVQQMQRVDFPHKLEMDRDHFRQLKWQQHRIHALRYAMRQIDTLLEGRKRQRVNPTRRWLDQADYADLLFISQIISPDKQKQCLINKANLDMTILDKLYTQAEKFKQCWGAQTSSMIRMYRIILFYADWHTYLKQQLQQLDMTKQVRPTEVVSWNAIFTVCQLNTYSKKDFFKQALAKENLIFVFEKLFNLLREKATFESPVCMRAYLQKEENRIKKQLTQCQENAVRHIGYWEQVVATLGLAVSQQPNFKLALSIYDLNLAALNELEQRSMPAVAAVDKKIEHAEQTDTPNGLQGLLNLERNLKIIRFAAAGISFAFEQYTSNWFGYTYRTIAAINHAVQAQFDLWMAMGQQWETRVMPVLRQCGQSVPNKYQTVVQSCLHKLRLDEIGLLEKELLLQWLTNLSIHLGMQRGESVVPAMLGFTAASSVASFAVQLVEKPIVRKYNAESRIFGIGKYFIHATAYSMTYAYTFERSYRWWRASSDMTEAKALEIFGFYKSRPDKCTIEKRYQTLVLEYDPDKCQTICGDLPFFSKNKPVQVDCLTDCQQAYAEKMHEVKQAYSVLKS